MFKAYANETDSLTLGELTVENRRDRVDLYGSLSLTRDKEGLARARELKKILEGVLSVLEKEALPEKVETKNTRSVKNPFQ